MAFSTERAIPPLLKMREAPKYAKLASGCDKSQGIKPQITPKTADVLAKILPILLRSGCSDRRRTGSATPRVSINKAHNQ
jgi:hypothetical protein